VLDSITEQLSLWDPAIRLRYANAALANWLGAPARAVVGARMADLVGPDIAELTQPFFQRVLDGEDVEFRRVVADADEVQRTFSVLLRPYRVAAEVVGVVMIGIDITAIVAAQAVQRATLTRVALSEERDRVATSVDALVLAPLHEVAEVLDGPARHDPGTLDGAALDSAAHRVHDAIGDLRAAIRRLQQPVTPAEPDDVLRIPRRAGPTRRRDIEFSGAPGFGSPARTPFTLAEIVALVDALPTLSVWDTHLVNQFANARAATGFGRPRTDIVGRHYVELAGETVAARNMGHAVEALRGTTQRFDADLVDAAGERRRIHFVYNPIRIGDRVAGLVALLIELPGEPGAWSSADALTEDRRRIAEDIHDHVIQRLYAAGLALDAVHREGPARRAGLLSDARTYVLDAIAQLQAAVHDFDELDADDLAQSFDRAIRRATTALGFAPRLDLIGDPHLVGSRVAGELLAVLTEALSNAARHARASSVRVMLASGPGLAWLRVADDGVGVGDTSRRSGLANMAARAERLGGRFSCHPREPHGTVIDWRVPRNR
jgi:PAS domain S-box-containing protein